MLIFICILVYLILLTLILLFFRGAYKKGLKNTNKINGKVKENRPK